MAEETRQNKLAAAKKKLKTHQVLAPQHNHRSPLMRRPLPESIPLLRHTGLGRPTAAPLGFPQQSLVSQPCPFSKQPSPCPCQLPQVDFEWLKEYWQRNSPGVPAGAERNRKTNGSGPETATSGGGHSPGDSAPGIHREGPTSSATLKDLEKQQKKQVEHQLEEEKKANNEKQKAERELEVQIQRLNTQKGKLNTDLYHRKCSLKNFEDESKGLAIHLQHSLQRIAELEWALSAVTTTQEKKEDSTSSCSKAVIEWQLERSIREQALLNAHMTQLKELLKQIQLERDEYAQHIKEERAQWQQRIRKMLQEVLTLKKEKKHETCRGKKLERSLSKLKNQMAEPLPPEPPAVPSEVELQHLRKEVDRVAEELKAQVDNNKHMSVLISGQKERLRE
nr:golgin subfamily A member 8S-like [Pongo pygmaeus]